MSVSSSDGESDAKSGGASKKKGSQPISFVRKVLLNGLWVAFSVALSCGILYWLYTESLPGFLEATGLASYSALQPQVGRNQVALVIVLIWLIMLSVALRILIAMFRLACERIRIAESDLDSDPVALKGVNDIARLEVRSRALVEGTIFAGATWIASGALVLAPLESSRATVIALGILLCFGALLVQSYFKFNWQEQLECFVRGLRKNEQELKGVYEGGAPEEKKRNRLFDFVHEVLLRGLFVTSAGVFSGTILYWLYSESWTGLLSFDALKILIRRDQVTLVIAIIWLVILLIALGILLTMFTLACGSMKESEGDPNYDQVALGCAKNIARLEIQSRSLVDGTVFAGVIWIASGSLVLAPLYLPNIAAIGCGILLSFGALSFRGYCRLNWQDQLKKFVFRYRQNEQILRGRGVAFGNPRTKNLAATDTPSGKVNLMRLRFRSAGSSQSLQKNQTLMSRARLGPRAAVGGVADCPTCRGTGKVKGERCTTCGGRGWIDAD